MSIASIILWIAIATLIILLFIVKLKVNPTIALAIGAMVLGIACKVGPVTTATTIGTGFGNLMASLGLPIGFGVILGELLSQCGAWLYNPDVVICRAQEGWIYDYAGFDLFSIDNYNKVLNAGNFYSLTDDELKQIYDFCKTLPKRK